MGPPDCPRTHRFGEYAETLVRLRFVVFVVLLSAVGLASGSANAASTRSTSTAPPACSTDHLSATGYWQGATTSMAGYVSFTNTGTRACSMRGYLPVTLRKQNGKPLPVVVRRAGPTLLPKPVLHPSAVVLAPRSPGTAGFLLQWWDWCGPKPGPVSVHVAVSSGQSLTVTPVGPGFVGTAGCLTGGHCSSWIAIAPVGKPR